MPYATNQGVRIQYWTEGAGPPLVIHHGFTDSAETWYELGYVDALKRDYRLILLDARGHGASDKPYQPEAYGMALMAGDVTAVLDAVDLPTAHFLGYSMGGQIGFALAKYAPERVHSLLLGGANPYKRDPTALLARIDRFQRGPGTIAEMWDAPVSPSIGARLLANDTEAFIALTQERIASPGLDDILPAMRMPCLLYIGEADADYPVVEACSARIPDATLVSFPGLTHVGTLFRPDLVVPEVKRFLQAVRTRPTLDETP
jgi:pimeloyl-ACP methyl ester carboxylesterase